MPPMGRFGQRLLPYLYLVAAVGRLIAAALRLGGLLVQAVAHGIARAAAVTIRSLIGHAVLFCEERFCALLVLLLFFAMSFHLFSK